MSDASLWSLKEFVVQLEARFKPHEGLQYCTWDSERAQGRMEFRTPTMNYNDESSRAKLVTVMYRETSPWIPVGRDDVDSGLIVLVTTAQSGHGPFCSLAVLLSFVFR